MRLLTTEQVQSYEADGFLVLDLLTKEEVEEISSDYDAIFKRKENFDLESSWGGNWDKPKEQNSVSSIHGMHMHSAVFSKLLFHEKTLDACEDLMNTSDIMLHHTKAHIKYPGKGAPYPMHQDYPYFPYKNDSMVAVFLNLDDSCPENGGLCVYPGSHKLGPLEDASGDSFYHFLDQTKYPLDKATPLRLKRGQMVVFSYLLIHGSYPNTSQRVRRMLLTQLCDSHDEPLKDMHRSAGQGLVLRGCNRNRDADMKNVLSGH